jgi:hypothetical protein
MRRWLSRVSPADVLATLAFVCIVTGLFLWHAVAGWIGAGLGLACIAVEAARHEARPGRASIADLRDGGRYVA